MTTKKVYTAIQAVMAALAKEGISKTRKNDQQGYRFRGIDEVFNALAPLLAEHQLLMLPRMLSRDVQERQTRSGGTLFYVTVEAEYDFVSAEDGSTHIVRTFGEAMDSGDKATNKAMSAAYKYAAFQAFCIPTDGDHDADKTTQPPIAARQSKASKPSSQLETVPDPDAPDAEREPEPRLTPAQRQRLGSIAKKMGRAPAEVSAWLKKAHGVTSSAQLPQSSYAAVVEALETRGSLPFPGDGE